MEWLNYHHLLYFWTVVRAGSIQKASAELRISSPAISTQLKLLEEQLGEKLLSRSGRRLVLTDTGKTVYGYAEDIFSLGRELLDVVKNRPIGRPLRLDVGVVDAVPKIVQLLIEPALHLREPVHIVCREANSTELLARLATHELDVVLSDSPVDPSLNIRAYSHLLGECGTLFVVVAKKAERFRRNFPKCLDGATHIPSNRQHCIAARSRLLVRVSGCASRRVRRVRGLRTSARIRRDRYRSVSYAFRVSEGTEKTAGITYHRPN